VNNNAGVNCDENIFNSVPTWVRFVGEGGTQIPTSAVGPNRCSTSAAGWYSGQMPTDSDETTNGTVCFSWQSNNCSWTKNILVTNCGSFYIYQLTAPPGCQMRYCTTLTSSASKSTVTLTSISSYIPNLFKKLIGW
jgi:uromodulin